MSDNTKIKRVTDRIADLLLEIQEEYYKAYPDGNYLTLCIWRDTIMFNNDGVAPNGKDLEFPINYYRKLPTEEVEG